MKNIHTQVHCVSDLNLVVIVNDLIVIISLYLEKLSPHSLKGYFNFIHKTVTFNHFSVNI